MATYVIVQDVPFFAVKLGKDSGPVLATFSNRMAAEVFIAKQRDRDVGAAKTPPDEAGRV